MYIYVHVCTYRFHAAAAVRVYVQMYVARKVHIAGLSPL